MGDPWYRRGAAVTIRLYPESASARLAPAGPSTAPIVAAKAVAAPCRARGRGRSRADAAQARRLENARAYLEQAREAGPERQRLATPACRGAGQGDVEARLAAADDVLQNELQAARHKSRRRCASRTDWPARTHLHLGRSVRPLCPRCVPVVRPRSRAEREEKTFIVSGRLAAQGVDGRRSARHTFLSARP